jgi:hypothetical protein
MQHSVMWPFPFHLSRISCHLNNLIILLASQYPYISISTVKTFGIAQLQTAFKSIAAILENRSAHRASLESVRPYEETHPGLTCGERTLQGHERLDETWANENGAEKCPSCSVWTQKVIGCNHMICNCGVHICWFCTGIFPRGDIYRHMNRVHGKIGVDVDAEVTVKQATSGGKYRVAGGRATVTT